MLLVKSFASIKELPQLIGELRQFPARGKFVRYLTVSKLSVSTEPSHPPWPLTLDGEAHRFDAFSAEVVPLAVRLAMPADSPLLIHNPAPTLSSVNDNAGEALIADPEPEPETLQ